MPVCSVLSIREKKIPEITWRRLILARFYADSLQTMHRTAWSGQAQRRATLPSGVTCNWLGGRGVARVKTYGDVFEEYEWHPESKSDDAKGDPAGKQTIGLLQRRHITIDHLIDAGRGRRRPHAKHRALLIMYARMRGVLR